MVEESGEMGAGSQFRRPVQEDGDISRGAGRKKWGGKRGCGLLATRPSLPAAPPPSSRRGWG